MLREDQATGLAGRTVLVVEDDYLIAAALAQALTVAGAHVVGPAPSEARARELVRRADMIDCAVLDIDLGGHHAWSLVDELVARGVVVVLASGYGANVIPDRHLRLPRSSKPVDVPWLAAAMRRRGAQS